MVKHIVLFKLTSFVTEDDKNRQLKMLSDIFSVFSNKSGIAADYRTGINISDTDSSWDFAIDSVFDNPEALGSYQDSPEHKEAVRQSGMVSKVKAVVDYEF